MKMEYKFYQINLNRCHRAFYEFKLLVEKNEPDFCLISEPCLNKKKSPSFIPGYVCFNTFLGKAVIYCKKDLKEVILLSDYSNSNIVVVSLGIGSKRLIIASFYIDHDDSNICTLNQIEMIIRFFMHSNLIMGGDSNSKSVLWNCKSTDTKGHKIEEILQNYDLSILNRGNTSTFAKYRCDRTLFSKIDISFASNRLIDHIFDWKVKKNAIPSSDHRLITFKVKFNESLNIPSSLDSFFRFHIKPSNWHKFEEEIKKRILSKNLVLLSHELASGIQIDDFVKSLTNVTQESSFHCFKTKEKRNYPSQNVNPILTLFRKQLRKIHHILNKLKKKKKDLSLFLIVREKVRSEYGKEIRRSSTEQFKKFCEENTSTNPWYLVRKLTNKINPTVPISTVKVNGIATTSVNETADAFVSKFFSKPPINSLDIHYDLEEKEELVSEGEPEPMFTIDEILYAIQTMNDKKSPGADFITVNIWKAVIKLFPDLFVNLLNKCLHLGHFPTPWKTVEIKVLKKPNKNDLSDLKSYRPIGLLPVLSKVLERLIKSRITFRSKIDKSWNSNQFGFRSGKSTEDALISICKTVKQAKLKNEATVLISLDIDAAFDSAWYPYLHERLRASKCPNNIHLLLINYLKFRLVNLHYGGTAVKSSTYRGVIQGSVLGPVLWNLVLDGLLYLSLPDHCSIGAFADDVFLLVRGKNREELESRTNSALVEIVNWSKVAKLHFNASKSQALCFHRKHQDVLIVMDGMDIPISKSIKILGIHLDNKLNFSTHIRETVKKVSLVSHMLMRSLYSKWNYQDIVGMIYNYIIVPIVTYGAGVWGHIASRKYVKRSLRSIQRKFLLRIIHGYTTTSTNATIFLSKEILLNLIVYKRRMISNTKRNLSIPGLPIFYIPDNKNNLLIHPADPYFSSLHNNTGERNRSLLVLNHQQDVIVDENGYQHFNLKAVKKVINLMIHETWKSEFYDSPQGKTTKLFFPTFEHFNTFIKTNQLSSEVTQILTGHGCSNSYLKWIKVKNHEKCPCGADIQDFFHLIENCPKWIIERKLLIDKLNHFNLNINEYPKIMINKEMSRCFIDFITTIVSNLNSYNQED